MASRPTYGEASRFVTSAWSGWPSSNVGAGMVSSSWSKSGRRPSSRRAGSGVSPGPPRSRVAVDDRELDLALVRVEIEEQLVHLVDDLGDPRVGAVDLVDDEQHGKAGLERLAEHEARLGQRAFARVDEEQHAVDHAQAPLHLAAEVGVARACRRC